MTPLHLLCEFGFRGTYDNKSHLDFIKVKEYKKPKFDYKRDCWEKNKVLFE